MLVVPFRQKLQAWYAAGVLHCRVYSIALAQPFLTLLRVSSVRPTTWTLNQRDVTPGPWVVYRLRTLSSVTLATRQCFRKNTHPALVTMYERGDNHEVLYFGTNCDPRFPSPRAYFFWRSARPPKTRIYSLAVTQYGYCEWALVLCAII